eukprot:6037606-Prymnesium_polylepis.1
MSGFKLSGFNSKSWRLRGLNRFNSYIFYPETGRLVGSAVPVTVSRDRTFRLREYLCAGVRLPGGSRWIFAALTE